jgi:transcriptional regulator with XRE-family HTH domain
MKNMDQIREKIKNLRKAKGLSQKEVADLLNITQAAYNRIESSDTSITLDRFLQLCELFAVEKYEQVLPLLPGVMNETVEELIMGGLSAFRLINTQSVYLRNKLGELNEKISSQEDVDRESLLKDLEVFDSFLQIIGSESFKYNSKFSDRINLTITPAADHSPGK